jgi:hypothetical protein
LTLLRRELELKKPTLGEFELKILLLGEFNLNKSVWGEFKIPILGEFDLKRSTLSEFTPTKLGEFGLKRSTLREFDLERSILGEFGLKRSTLSKFDIETLTFGEIELSNTFNVSTVIGATLLPKTFLEFLRKTFNIWKQPVSSSGKIWILFLEFFFVLQIRVQENAQLRPIGSRKLTSVMMIRLKTVLKGFVNTGSVGQPKIISNIFSNHSM